MNASPPPPAAPSPAVPAPAPPHRPLDLPLIGAEYPSLLRTPRARWWNPLASLGMVLAGIGVLMVMALIGYGIAALADPSVMDEFVSPSAEGMADLSTVDLLVTNLMLAALIGVAVLAVAVGHPVAARFVHSVEGRVRWRWLLRAHLTMLPLFLLYVVGSWALDGAPTLPRSEDWLWLLAMALLLTPLQAAGEEYLFRGWIMLAVGTWVRRPVLAVVVSAAVSAVTFALIHGSLDPWVLMDLGVFAVAAVILTWRTGGLEAAVALHVVNNVMVFALEALIGPVYETTVTPEFRGDPLSLLVSATVIAVATALLLWQARRAGVARTVPVSAGARP